MTTTSHPLADHEVHDLAVATTDLRKTFLSRRGRRQVAVEGLDLRVPAGGVHGFLGPNGSGKTTSIRMLLGLVRPDSGTMQIFGMPVPAQLPQVVGRIGAIVESPKFFPNFSGRRNLELLAAAIDTPVSRVGVVLDESGLGDRGKDRFATYSLGMKQRLAIAATLLKDPDLLIFDEPTNGLDPAGIHEIRATMRSLGEQGKTVLVSSHILAEVEHVADTVSIIARGRLLASGTVADVIGSGHPAGFRVRVTEPDTARLAMTAAGWQVRADSQHDGHLVVEGVADGAEITRLLAGAGLWVSELTPIRADLESVFLEITRDTGIPDAVEPGRHR